MKKNICKFFLSSGMFLPVIIGAAEEIQPALQASPAQATSSSLTISNIITGGGGLMYILLAMSVLALMLIIFYSFTIREKIILPSSFLEVAEDAARRGDAAALVAAATDETMPYTASPAARIIAQAFANIVQNNAKFDKRECEVIMEEEGARQITLLWDRLHYLMDVSTIAPMVGLLGTVWGMMVSFTGLETGLNMVNKADRLASGVSQAMFTTFGGLIIGIIGLGAYAIFRGRLNRLTGLLEQKCADILRHFAYASEGKTK